MAGMTWCGMRGVTRRGVACEAWRGVVWQARRGVAAVAWCGRHGVV